MSDDTDEPRPPTLSEKIARAVGYHDYSVPERARLAGWTPARFKTEMAEGDGWIDRFKADLLEGEIKQATAYRFRVLVQSGPSSLTGKLLPDLLGYIKHPKLAEVPTAFDLTTSGGILALGPTDIGKSVMCAATALVSIERDERARRVQQRQAARFAWVRAFDLPNARLAQPLGQGEAEIVLNAKNAAWCCIDDLGWEANRAGSADVVIEVIAARYDAGLPTLCTSGLKYAEIESRYGDSVIRRITSPAGKVGRVVNCWGKESKQ